MSLGIHMIHKNEHWWADLASSLVNPATGKNREDTSSRENQVRAVEPGKGS